MKLFSRDLVPLLRGVAVRNAIQLIGD